MYPQLTKEEIEDRLNSTSPNFDELAIFNLIVSEQFDDEDFRDKLAQVKNDKWKEIVDCHGRNVFHVLVLAGRVNFVFVLFFQNLFESLRNIEDPESQENPMQLAKRCKNERIVWEIEEIDKILKNLNYYAKLALKGDQEMLKSINDKEDVLMPDISVAHVALISRNALIAEKFFKIARQSKLGFYGRHVVLEAVALNFLQGVIAIDKQMSDKDKRGQMTPMDMCAACGNIQMLEELRKRKFPLGSSTLVYAAARNKLEMVHYLLGNKEIDVNGTDSEGNKRTALHSAAEHGHKEMLKLLLDHGANLEAVDASNRDALHYAVLKDNIACLKILIAAAEEKKILRTLLSTKGKVNIRNEITTVKGRRNAWTVWNLVCVERKYKYEFCRALDLGNMIRLPQYGKLLASTDKEFVGPGTFSTKEYDAHATTLNAKPDLTALHQAILSQSWACTEFLISKMIPKELNVTEINEMAAVHLAVILGHWNIVDVLVKAGADLECKDKNGNTPLDIAKMNNHILVIHYLSRNSCIHSTSQFFESSILPAVDNLSIKGLRSVLLDPGILSSPEDHFFRHIDKESVKMDALIRIFFHNMLNDVTCNEPEKDDQRGMCIKFP